MSAYRFRAVDQQLEDWLEAVGAVAIQGAKWCGKTTTVAQHAKSSLYMDDPFSMQQSLQMANTNPKRLLEGETPRLIDEWEMAPQLWDAARFEVDHRENHVGQFIFTGSATPKEKDKSKIFHSGTGRFAWLTMRPMSLWESGESTGEVSLESLFLGQEPEGNNAHITLDDLAFLTCRGGWPGALDLKPKAALKIPNAYLDGVINSDISRIDYVKRDPLFMSRIIKSLARHQGGQIPVSTIYSDLSANAPSMSIDTIENYVNVLKKIFLEEDMPAWNPNLRSKTAIRTSDTRYFVDPSIINYVEVGKPNGNALGYLKDVQLEYNYQTLPLEMNKSAIMMYVSELLSKTLAGQEQNDDLYLFMVKSLQWLDLVESGFGNFPLFFTLELTRFLGFYPKPGYSDGFCFDMMEGLFTHDYPLHPYYLDASASALLYRLLGKGIDEACRVPLNVNQRRELMDGLIVFMRLHAPVMKNFQSHEVLKSVLQ